MRPIPSRAAFHGLSALFLMNSDRGDSAKGAASKLGAKYLCILVYKLFYPGLRVLKELTFVHIFKVSLVE